MIAARFEDYGQWLKSPEYKAQMAKLLSDKPAAPRVDYATDLREVADRNFALMEIAINASRAYASQACQAEQMLDAMHLGAL